jgi:hypothetical protein
MLKLQATGINQQITQAPVWGDYGKSRKTSAWIVGAPYKIPTEFIYVFYYIGLKSNWISTLKKMKQNS